MKTAKTGRVYVRNGVPHQASAPGQAPAVEPMGFSVTAGQLLASITTMRTGRYSGEVFTAVEYAKYLELGTKTPMAPRPFMRPAARMTRTEMNVIAPEKFRVRIARAAK
jgi:HK97 gp10 family phage protein